MSEELKHEDIVLEEYIGRPALLEQTAEECTELAHACLKLARKIRGENLTPKSEQDCIDALVEENADMMICLEQVIDISNIVSHEAIESVYISKTERMEKRINAFK